MTSDPSSYSGDRVSFLTGLAAVYGLNTLGSLANTGPGVSFMSKTPSRSLGKDVHFSHVSQGQNKEVGKSTSLNMSSIFWLDTSIEPSTWS